MRVAIAHCGGPTAVVNRSVGAFVDAGTKHEVLGVHGGPSGLVNSDWSSVTPGSVDRRSPGSWLRGGRRRTTPADITRIVENLVAADVQGLCLLGGNGTMALLSAVRLEAESRGVALRCVGIPKTIDNDLLLADPSPGYASAAAFLARTVTDLAYDHDAIRSIEPVRIIETMGRGAGWLALAATRTEPDLMPDLVVIPEMAFDLDRWLGRVSDAVDAKGRCMVLVSEGAAPDLNTDPVHAANHDTLIHGGVARTLAQAVRSSLGLPARGEVLGCTQRSASWAVTRFDAALARDCGALAFEWLIGGDVDAVMVGVGPGGPTPAPLSQVGGTVRVVPEAWRSANPSELTSFHEWLMPFVTELDT